MNEYQQATKDLLISLKLDPDFSLARSLLDSIKKNSYFCKIYIFA